jgi:oligopeptide transport system substrate-binding protein
MRNIQSIIKKSCWPVLLTGVISTFIFSAVACRSIAVTNSTDVLSLYGADPITLDPAISGEMVSHSYITQLFSGLVCLNDKLEVVPDIAERWQESPDGCTYTFYLRQGVKFHNGKQVLAEDFKYSWERACNPETGSQTAATYLGDIIGAREVLAGEREQLSGVKVIGDYILQVSIDAPKAYFLCKLTYPTAFVVDKANVETEGKWWRQPVGTGPFELVEWIPRNVLVLERNELYYAELARLDQIVFHLLAGIPMVMYERGEIDITPVYQNYIDLVNDTASLFHDELVVFPELSFYYIGFNVNKEPFNDLNIRQAFCYAVDKGHIINVILRGMVTEAGGVIPPGMPGYDDTLKGLDYDSRKARELIATSKYGETAKLPPIAVTIPGYGNSIPEYLGAMIEDWRKNLGVEVSVRQLETEDFLYHFKEESDEMFMLGWVADYPDPDNFLNTLFYSSSENNAFGYNNPEVDVLLDDAAIEHDSILRLSLYQQVEKQVVGEAICLPFSFGMNYILVKPYVKDYLVNPLGIPDLRRVYIEDD